MSEIQSISNYWVEFFKTHPDPTGFRALVAEDPILIKIFNFSSVPWIWNDFRNYPFDAKRAELKTISKGDKEYLAKKRFEPESNHKGWLDYLGNLFDVVSSTLMVKDILDIHNKKKGGVKQDEEIIKSVESIFSKFISRDETIVFREVNGVQKFIRRYGRYYPVRWVNVIETRDKNRGLIETVCQEHFILPPTKEEVAQAMRGWDRFSVVNLEKYGKEVRDISFGNLSFHGSDSIKYSDSVRHTVELYYKGELLDSFTYPLQKRYRPLGEKIVRRIMRKYHTSLGTREELLATFDEKLYEKALRYDPTSDVDPAGYFKAALGQYFEHEIFEDLSTTTFDAPCDSSCKAEKEHMNKPPCEFEDSRGYCTDPKRQRGLKSVIESSGGRLSDPILDKEGQKTKKTLEDILSDLEDSAEEKIIKREFIERIFKDFPKLRGIIDKEEQEITLTENERQIKSRSLKKIEHTREKYLKD